MHLSQAMLGDGPVGIVRLGTTAHALRGGATIYDLALNAVSHGRTMREEIMAHGMEREALDLPALLEAGKMALPVTHPDPAHMFLTGTGLTHLGSAATRDSMHVAAQATDATDSMKMFRMGIEGGKPDTLPGVQPEWFWKGTGAGAVAPGAPLVSPAFALDGGEEPEVAGIYIIAPDGVPVRIGWALSNEFSDHAMERINYLYLAHSKIRPCSFGPEILVGELPAHVEGTSRIRRAGKVLWEKPFLSGEANMSHSFANLEHHQFKYGLFRQPGDLHVHMFGTATLSVADGITTEPGDVFEIESPAFGLPLVNPLAAAPDDGVAEVRAL
ncbi:MAG: GguC protein [Rubellimicrobium sp.]|nr:GguC protein [Rubellimicrobium sp.]